MENGNIHAVLSVDITLNNLSWNVSLLSGLKNSSIMKVWLFIIVVMIPSGFRGATGVAVVSAGLIIAIAPFVSGRKKETPCDQEISLLLWRVFCF